MGGLRRGVFAVALCAVADRSVAAEDAGEAFFNREWTRIFGERCFGFSVAAAPRGVSEEESMCGAWRYSCALLQPLPDFDESVALVMRVSI